MTPPVKPARRRAANLVTTFTPDEVRLVCKVLAEEKERRCAELEQNEAELHAASLACEALDLLDGVADKFARLREKARTGS